MDTHWASKSIWPRLCFEAFPPHWMETIMSEVLGKDIKRVGILFAGGPAPAANAVISSAAMAFLAHKIEVVGILHGYSSLNDYDAEKRPLVEGSDYRLLQMEDVEESRNFRGIMIGSARTNPGKYINCAADLEDAEKAAPLRRTYDALCSIGVDALISIGGDDTLKTANKLYEYQRHNPSCKKHIRVIHLPKTIDNDYRGIDFTFGFFTAVNLIAEEVLNLRADSKASNAYFIVECMGRKAGWLSYGVAIAGEAQMVISVEDIPDIMHEAGREDTEFLDVDVLVNKIVNLILAREKRGHSYGVVILAEGLAEKLPPKFLETIALDEHGHISLGDLHLGHMVAKKVAARYQEITGKKKKVNGVQYGYESRCALPHAFDVMLGSALGAGAFDALVLKGLDGHMVSTVGQLDLTFVPFSELVDPVTLVTEVRYIDPNSDFHRLAKSLADDLNK